MKLITILFGLFFSLYLSASVNINDFTVAPDEVCSYYIVEQTESCTIVAIETHDNAIILNVIAGIATSLIPEAVEALCTNAGNSPAYCEVGYTVAEALVSLGSGKIAKGVVRGMKWIAKKMGFHTASKVSKAAVEVKSYEAANAMKSVFKAYRDAGCMKWQSTEVKQDNNEFADWQSGNSYSSYSYTSNSYAVYTVNWRLGYANYSGLLKLNSFGEGTLRVVYPDATCQCNQMVEQRMTVQATANGIIFLGSNPTDVRTGVRNYNYAADNFLVTVNAYGGVNMQIVDAAGVTAYGRMEVVQNASQKARLLASFGMR